MRGLFLKGVHLWKDKPSFAPNYRYCLTIGSWLVMIVGSWTCLVRSKRTRSAWERARVAPVRANSLMSDASWPEVYSNAQSASPNGSENQDIWQKRQGMRQKLVCLGERERDPRTKVQWMRHGTAWECGANTARSFLPLSIRELAEPVVFAPWLHLARACYPTMQSTPAASGERRCSHLLPCGVRCARQHHRENGDSSREWL